MLVTMRVQEETIRVVCLHYKLFGGYLHKNFLEREKQWNDLVQKLHCSHFMSGKY